MTHIKKFITGLLIISLQIFLAISAVTLLIHYPVLVVCALAAPFVGYVIYKVGENFWEG